jgi:hypothetical protein
LIEAALFAALAALLYHLGLGFLLFLVPVQVVLVRRGPRSFYAAAGFTFVLVMAVKLVFAGGGLGGALPFLVAEGATVAAMLGGLVLVQLPEIEEGLVRTKLRRVPRLLAVTALAGLMAVPVVLYLRADETFTGGLREMFGGLAATLNRALRGTEGLDLLGETGSELIKPEALMEAVREFLWRSFLFGYFFVLAFAWRVGSAIGARTIGQKAGFRPLRDFSMPDSYIWPLIGSLAVVAVNLVVPLGVLELAAWNLLLIMALLYGLTGLGIIRFLLRKYRLPPALRWLLVGGIVVMALTPRLNLAVMVLVPGLGVSEIWVKYRKERSEINKP